jgi:predicted alpha/beta-hydrolase family hydrolase
VKISTDDGVALAEIAWPAAEGTNARSAQTAATPAQRPGRGGGKSAVAPFLLVLTHGSGRGPDTADLLAVRDAALELGGAVALVTQPFLVKGRRAPGAPARQDAAWVKIIGALRRRVRTRVLIQGGRSNGARVACRTARAVGACAVLALAFPLHPPGRPERSRAAELAEAGTDVLVINGSRDAFGIPEPAAARQVVVLPGETHALSKEPGAVGAAAGAWLRGLLG